MSILSESIIKALQQIQSLNSRLAFEGARYIETDSYGCRNACSGSCEGSCHGSCDMSCTGGCDHTFGYE